MSGVATVQPKSLDVSNTRYVSGKKDLITTIFTEIWAFTYCLATAWQGGRKNISKYGFNPTRLSAEDAKKPAVIILHGYKGNWWTVKKIAEAILQTGEFIVFTENVDYNDDDPRLHHRALRAFFEHMTGLYQAHGKEMHLTCIGHSRAGTELARLAYCKLPKKPIDHCTIDKVISIAGRLRVTPKCHPAMIDLCNKVDQGIQNHPEIPLRVIVPKRDWQVPYNAAMVVKDPKHAKIVYNRSHLGVALAPETIQATQNFLREDATDESADTFEHETLL